MIADYTERMETKASETKRHRPTWEEVCKFPESDQGAVVRFHYRPLPPSIWTKLAWRYGYHTWMELLGSDGSELASERRIVWGVYEGRHQRGPKKGEHNGIAEASWMNWEYVEDGGLARWGSVGRLKHGFMDVTLPTFSRADFQHVMKFVFDDVVINIGPYGYLLPWLGPLLGVWNCQRYVRVFCRKRGGPHSIFHELGRRFYRGE